MRRRRVRAGAAPHPAARHPAAPHPAVPHPAARHLAGLPVAGLAALAVLLLAALSGCGPNEVDRVQLETQVQRSVESRANPRLEVRQVSCPQRLRAERGAQTRCSISTMAGKTVTALVTVTGTANNMLQFDLKLDQNPS
jgi:hypothetical protein